MYVYRITYMSSVTAKYNLRVILLCHVFFLHTRINIDISK